MGRPLVSVLIDTYNHERFIEEAIVSVLDQDFPQDKMEILVIDDGSTDRTPEVIRRFGSRVRYIRKENGGQASAFNAGIPLARGEFVAFLDGDDWWAREKLSRAIHTFESEPDLGVVGHGDVFAFPDGARTVHVLREGIRFRASTLEGAKAFRARKCFMGTCRMTIKASLAREIVPIPETLWIQADEYLMTLAAILSDVRILPEALFYYRLHGENSFQFSEASPERAKRKQQVLADLFQLLSEELGRRGIDPQVKKAITETVKADADRLRLELWGGRFGAAAQTEWACYRIAHPDAPVVHRAFKTVTLLPALVLPPKLYYRVRRRIVTNARYLAARQRWFPVLRPSHVITHELRTRNSGNAGTPQKIGAR